MIKPRAIDDMKGNIGPENAAMLLCVSASLEYRLQLHMDAGGDLIQ
jgi:hypothetical protein